MGISFSTGKDKLQIELPKKFVLKDMSQSAGLSGYDQKV